MPKRNKYVYLYVVQGHYTALYGWEDLSASESRREALSDLKAYRREGDPHAAVDFRMIQRRELNPAP